MSVMLDTLRRQFRGDLSDVISASPPETPAPDDLDLIDSARAALNYLRGNPDPARGYECKFSLGPLGIPCHVPLVPSNEYAYDPVSLGDTDSRMDWQYAHMREMVGEKEPDPVEQGVRRRILSYMRDDHLCWVNPSACVGQPVDGTWVITWTTAKLLYALAESHRRTGDPKAKATARSIFLALKSLAQWDGPRAWYPGIAPYKDGQWLTVGWCKEHSRNYPFIVEPCVRYWECTGSEEALEFAKAVADGFLAGSQPDQGEMRIDPETGAFQKHVHMHTHAIWGVAHLGAVLNETRYLTWVQKAYDFVLANGTDYGWYPEFIPQGEWRSETCVVGDMVSTGVWLARGGMPQCWDHVERTVRNELRKAQFFLSPKFLDLFRRVHANRPHDVIEQALVELRKIEGGFLGQTALDDWVSYVGTLGEPGLSRNGIHMMGCCSPEGMRGIWEAWNGVVEERSDGVYVNMSITRDHPAANVRAYGPESGRLDVTARRSGVYLLRPPAWAVRDQVRLLWNDKEVPVAWGGPARAYVVCNQATSGEVLMLRYSVPAFRQTFSPTSVPGRSEEITVRWVGNTVVGVQPCGKHLPKFGDRR